MRGVEDPLSDEDFVYPATVPGAVRSDAAVPMSPRDRAAPRSTHLDEHVGLEEHLDADEGRRGHRHRQPDVLGDRLDACHERLDLVRGPLGDVRRQSVLDKWSVLVLETLCDRPRRFNQLRRLIP